MTAEQRIEVYRRADTRWGWRAIAANGRKVDTPGQGFTRKWSAKRSARKFGPKGWRILVVRDPA